MQTPVGIGSSVGLEVMLTVHNERSLDYAALEPDVLGVNNCDLSTWITDVRNQF